MSALYARTRSSYIIIRVTNLCNFTLVCNHLDGEERADCFA